jgi:hypothetical protein
VKERDANMAEADTFDGTSAALASAHATVRKKGESASVAELVDMILDKGIVIDAWTSVPVLGLELLTIEARVVAVSVASYLRYAESMCMSTPVHPAQVPVPVVEVLSARGAGPGPVGRTDRPRGRSRSRCPCSDPILPFTRRARHPAQRTPFRTVQWC